MSSKNVPTILAASAALRARRPLPSASSSSSAPGAGAPAAPAVVAAPAGLGVVAGRLMAFLKEGGWWSIDEIATRLAARGKCSPATHSLKRRVSDVLCVALMLGRVACVSRKTSVGAGQSRFVRCYSATDASVDLLDPSMDSLLNAEIETESKEDEAEETPVASKRRSSASTERAAKRSAVPAQRPEKQLPPPITFRPIAEPPAFVYPPSEPDSAPRSPRACPVFRPLVGDGDDPFLRLTPVCIPPSPRPCAFGASSPTDSDDVVPATPFELWPTFESASHAYLGSE